MLAHKLHAPNAGASGSRRARNDTARGDQSKRQADRGRQGQDHVQRPASTRRSRTHRARRSTAGNDGDVKRGVAYGDALSKTPDGRASPGTPIACWINWKSDCYRGRQAGDEPSTFFAQNRAVTEAPMVSWSEGDAVKEVDRRSNLTVARREFQFCSTRPLAGISGRQYHRVREE